MEFRNWVWEFELIRVNLWLLSFHLQDWDNEFLTWDASKYGDVDRVHFAPDEIWVPDIALYNK